LASANIQGQINLPFGGAAMATVLFFFKNPTRANSSMVVKKKLNELDFVGAFFLVPGVVCLLLALQWGGTTYPWKDSKVWGCFLGFGLLISIFIVIQIRKGERATIPPSILKQRSILATALTLLFISMGMYTHIFYLPFYFQAVKGSTAELSGIRVIPYLVSNAVLSIITGGLVTVIGYYTPFINFGTASMFSPKRADFSDIESSSVYHRLRPDLHVHATDPPSNLDRLPDTGRCWQRRLDPASLYRGSNRTAHSRHAERQCHRHILQ
jgi:hypothetical protein